MWVDGCPHVGVWVGMGNVLVHGTCVHNIFRSVLLRRTCMMYFLCSKILASFLKLALAFSCHINANCLSMQNEQTNRFKVFSNSDSEHIKSYGHFSTSSFLVKF